MHPSCSSGEKQPALQHFIGRLVAGWPGTIQRPQRLPLDMEISHRKMQMSGFLAYYFVKPRKLGMRSSLAKCMGLRLFASVVMILSQLYFAKARLWLVCTHLDEVFCAMPLRGFC